MAESPTSRDEGYRLIDVSFKELLGAIDGLPPERMSTPVVEEWSVKDLLTHVTSWDEFIIVDYRRFGRGYAPAFQNFTPEMLNPYNATIMALRRAFPAEQILDELQRTRAEVIRVLDALDDSHFTAGFVPFSLGLTAQHDTEHAGHIRAWRDSQGI